MAIKEVAYNIKSSGGYDKYYFETSTNVVVDLEQGKSLKQILTEINGRTTANQTSITNNFNQNEYQLPIVVGTQLRLTKSNTSKRFFVQLANTLTGTITISTDSGATSKPLRDVSGIAVTSLEKGFAEIVEDATFFTLRNRGISAADLQALITAANEVEANSIVLREQYITEINATQPNDVLPNNATWIEILNEIQSIIETSTKTSSGSKEASSSNLAFQYFGNTSTASSPFLEVPFSEIGFIPSFISIESTSVTSSTNNTIYDLNSALYPDTARLSRFNPSTIGSETNRNFKANFGNAYVNENGFRLPVLTANATYDWKAWL